MNRFPEFLRKPAASPKAQIQQITVQCQQAAKDSGKPPGRRFSSVLAAFILPFFLVAGASAQDEASSGLPVVSILPGDAITEGGNAVFRVVAEPPPAPETRILVNIRFSQDGDFAGPGQSGSRVVSINSGGANSVTVATIDDELKEGHGRISARLAAGDGYAVSESAAVARIEVNDDDTEPARPIVSITAGRPIIEGQEAVFMLTATPPPARGDIKVNLLVADRGEFLAEDTHGSHSVRIDSEGEAILRIPTVDDEIYDPEGRIIANISVGSGYDQHGDYNSARVRVRDDEEPPPAEIPVIGVAKEFVEAAFIDAETVRATLRFHLRNYGNGAAHDLQLEENFAANFPEPVTVMPAAPARVVSGSLRLNPNFDGMGDTAMLPGTGQFAAGAGATIELGIDITLNGAAGPFTNQVLASARDAAGKMLSDLSHAGANPDPDGDGDPTEAGENEPTIINFSAAALGTVYADHDADGMRDAAEGGRAGWLVQLLDGNGAVIGSAVSDAQGAYFLPAPATSAESIRVKHPETGMSWSQQSVELAPHTVAAIDFPIAIGGVVYDSVARTPIAGVRLRLSNAQGTHVVSQCLLPGQQDQIVGSDGAYRFDLQAGAHGDCPAGAGDYAIEVVEAPSTFLTGDSLLLPPERGSLDVAACGAGAACIVQAQYGAPMGADDATWYRRLTLTADAATAFHNHLPLDPVDSPVYAGLISVNKEAMSRFASVGEPVGYEIRLTNTTAVTLRGIELRDNLPDEFNFIADSASIQETGDSPFDLPAALSLARNPSQPIRTIGNDPVIFGPFDLAAGSSVVIRYLTRPTTRANQGSYTNTATPLVGARIVGNAAEATVNIASDPLFEQTTVLGQVFLDRDGDGLRGEDEPGVPGVRLATVDGLLIETDANGRYHVAAVEVDNASRGANFIIKLDPATLPDGARVISQNPRVLRVTQSLMSRIDFAVQFDASHVRELYEEAPARAIVERTLTRYNTDRLQPVRFESGVAEISQEDIDDLQQLLDEYEDRDNLRVRFVGHTDDVPLSVRIAPQFGDNQGLSEARAAEVAEFFSQELALDPGTVEIEGRAFRQPVASNLTEAGRALNRRVEIEVVFDEQITETSEEFEPDDPANLSTEPETETSFNVLTDLVEPVRFTPDSVTLNNDQRDALNNSLEAFNSPDVESVRLSGVSYVAPGSGDAAAEAALEQARQRAANVGAAIAEALGLDDSQLVVEARTTTELLAADTTEFGQSVNRRVEIEVSYRTIAEVVSSQTIVLQPAQLAETSFVEGAGRVWMTEDAFSRDARLAVLALQAITVNVDGQMTAPASFAAHGNYEGVAESYRLDLYRATDVDLARPVASVGASALGWPEAFSLFDQGLNLEPGEQLAYVLRVFDSNGNEDHTTAQLVDVVAAGQGAGTAVAPENVIGRSILEGRQIRLEGSKLRIHGAGFAAGEMLSVAGADVKADVNGSFISELFLAEGGAEIAVEGGAEGSRWREILRPEIDDNYSFIVGLASLTLGQDSFGGALEALTGADSFDESMWFDGRIAFYAKARIQGKYLLTAQMDSTEDDLDNLGDNLFRRDARRMFRQLDPDRYYPVYGDDSTTVSDVDTQGALYVRLDWDRNQLLFGNYNTGLTGTENLAYNRSLYGLRGQYESDAYTVHGDPRYSATGFVSESESAAAHVSFRATGGSVYYLKHTDVVQGSEKVWMEVRQRDTRQAIERREFVAGLDYEIDPIQGRILLRQPLQPVSNAYNNAIIRRGIDGDQVHLLVDYEYLPASFSGDNLIAGGRGKVWLTDNIGIGATSITDDSTGEDYRLNGVDVSVKASPGTYFNVEIASSDASQSAAGFESFDGGLRFSSMDYSMPGQMTEGDAVAVESRLDIADISDMFSGNVRAWWKDRDAGFSSGNIMRSQVTREAGVDAIVRDDGGMLVQASVSELEDANGDSTNVARVQGDITRGRFTVGGELRYEDLARVAGPAAYYYGENSRSEAGDAIEGDAVLAGARVGYALNDDQTLYGKVQTGLDEGGDYVENDRVAAGLETRVSDTLSVLVEASDGDLGSALSGGVTYAPVQNFSFDVLSGVGSGAVSEFGGNYRMESGHEVYASYLSDPDRTFGDGDLFTLGQRRDFGNRFGVYTESHFGENDRYAGANHSFGIDYATESDWILNGVVTTANDDLFDNPLERDAVSLGASVDREDYKFSARTEHRTDQGPGFEVDQQLLATSYSRILSESSRVLGRLNLLRTDDDSLAGGEHARFTEFDIGHAYRPAALERWTALTRYSYLYDAAGAYQLGGGPDQRVHILSGEALYQLNPRWEIGGKIAWKNGEARANRGVGDWYDYEVSLMVARARYEVVREWDLLAEYRVLEDRSAGNTRSGVLLGAYRSLSENFQLGGGYNFSDFSDDLRDAEYDKRGFFIDFVGTL